MTIIQVDYYDVDTGPESFTASKAATGEVPGFLQLLDDDGKTVALVNEKFVRAMRLIYNCEPSGLRQAS